MHQELAWLTVADSDRGGRRVMIGSLGRSAGEEDRDCMQERNLRNGSLLSTSFATDGLTPVTMQRLSRRSDPTDSCIIVSN